jgi:hypothetical protein
MSFGRGRFQLLQDAIDRARALVESGSANATDIKRAERDLRETWANASESDAGPAVRELLHRLATANVKIEPREVELPACVVCRGGEFLRAYQPYEGMWGVALHMVICRACGDVRWIADPKQVLDATTEAALPAFELVVIKQPPRSPLR